MASWSIPWSFIGWHKNELCWIISLSRDWSISHCDALEREMILSEIPDRWFSFEGKCKSSVVWIDSRWAFVENFFSRNKQEPFFERAAQRTSTKNIIQIKVRFVYNLLNCSGEEANAECMKDQTIEEIDLYIRLDSTRLSRFHFFLLLLIVNKLHSAKTTKHKKMFLAFHFGLITRSTEFNYDAIECWLKVCLAIHASSFHNDNRRQCN